jgi:hypothetical protein
MILEFPSHIEDVGTGCFLLRNGDLKPKKSRERPLAPLKRILSLDTFGNLRTTRGAENGIIKLNPG